MKTPFVSYMSYMVGLPQTNQNISDFQFIRVGRGSRVTYFYKLTDISTIIY